MYLSNKGLKLLEEATKEYKREVNRIHRDVQTYEKISHIIAKYDMSSNFYTYLSLHYNIPPDAQGSLAYIAHSIFEELDEIIDCDGYMEFVKAEYNEYHIIGYRIYKRKGNVQKDKIIGLHVNFSALKTCKVTYEEVPRVDKVAKLTCI